MALKISSGLREHLSITGSLRAAMNDGFIKVYSGAVPADADAAVTGTLLCVFSTGNVADSGLMFEAATSNGALVKDSTDTWSGTVEAGAAGAVPTYYRHVVGAAETTDGGGSSTSLVRIQGTVGNGAGDLNFTDAFSPGWTTSETKTIDFYSIQVPLA